MRKLSRTVLTLKKRADTLSTLLRQAASEYQLFKAAEKVRDARIRVLRAKIGEMPSVLLTAQQKRRIAKLSDQIESLRATTPMEILTEFRRMLKNADEDS
jgi:predicted  nucleic acid-binding Zn-ribbon protein